MSTPRSLRGHFYLQDKMIPDIGSFIKVYEWTTDFFPLNWGVVDGIEEGSIQNGPRIWLRGLGDEYVRYDLWEIRWEIA